MRDGPKGGAVSRDEFLENIAAKDASSRKFGFGFVALGVVLFVAALFWR